MQGWGGMIGNAIEELASCVRVAFALIVFLAASLAWCIAWFFWGVEAAWFSVVVVLVVAGLFIWWVAS